VRSGTPKKESRLVRLDSDGMAPPAGRPRFEPSMVRLSGRPATTATPLRLTLARMTDDILEVREAEPTFRTAGWPESA